MNLESRMSKWTATTSVLEIYDSVLGIDLLSIRPALSPYSLVHLPTPNIDTESGKKLQIPR